MSQRGRRLSPADRREQLLDVARREFEHSQYEDVTFEGIAESAAVSPALVHHYFGTKRELFLALVHQAISGFARAVRPPADGVADGAAPPATREALRAALDRYLDFVLERPNGYAFVIGAHGAPDLEIRAAIAAAREAVLGAVLEVVGITAPTERERLAMWGWLGFVERVTTRWVDEGAHDRPALVALLLEAAEPVLRDR
jgi:AcrR family transcriptional regulator